MGGATGHEIPFGAIDLFDNCGTPVNSMVAAYAVHHACSISIADAYTESGFDFSGTKEFDRNAGQFLLPEQVVNVDVTRVPGYVAPPAA